MNKSIEYVESEDDTKDTDTQTAVPEDDEEQVDDIDESKSEKGAEDEEEDDSEDKGKKTFKSREERAEFFKNKKKKVTEQKDDSGDALTKADLYKMNEKKAISDLTEVSEGDSPELRQYKTFVNDRWDDVVQHINMRTVNKLDVESYKKAIRRAVIIVKSEDPESEDTADTDARKTIMKDGGAKGSSPHGSPKKKTTILGATSKGMDDWFPKKD